MITCPWCGTSYLQFQSNCSRCGGPLHAPEAVAAAGEAPLTPPSPPRPISNAYLYKMMFSEAWSIAALVFVLLGFVFSVVGGGLTLGMVTAFIGLPFLGLGLIFLFSGAAILVWRYQSNREIVRVLQTGQSTLGKISEVNQNYNVRINGRFPWRIAYQFTVNGASYAGKVNTLNQPGGRFQPGKPVYILYSADKPEVNCPYPHP